MSDHTTAGNGPPPGRPPPVILPPADPPAAEATADAEKARKHPVFDHAESVGKLATVVVGVLYVLGVLISNIQLMELGISDFGSLQPRNILTGFFFVLYITLLLLVLMPWVVMFVAFRRIRRQPTEWKRINWYALAFLVWFCAFLLAAWVAGELFGFLYPWGLPFRALISWITSLVHNPLESIYAAIEHLFQQAGAGLRQKTENFWEAILQFMNAFVHLKIFVASLLFLVTAYLVLPIIDSIYEEQLERKRKRQERQATGVATSKNEPETSGNEKQQEHERREKKNIDLSSHIAKSGISPRHVLIYIIVLLALVLPLMVFDYGEEVYPNLAYNLGGGQPQVAEFVLTGRKSDIAGLAFVGLQGNNLCCDEVKDLEQAVKTDEVAIWYQSDKFIYVSSLSGVVVSSPPMPAQVVAIDLKLVRNMRYLPKYVEVYSGGSIKRIWQRTADGVVPAAATAAPAAAIKPPIAWAQLRPDEGAAQGQLIARAKVEAGSPCPEVILEGRKWWNGKAWRMAERWSATNEPFGVKICEIAYPGYLSAKIGGTTLKARPADPQTIVVIGDTGCRIKDGSDTQDCNNAWPFKKIAEKAAALNPDLVIHVGDYHYRETKCADRDKCDDSPHGDNWATWQADFFDPAAPLLAQAPWVMLRGNHEGFTRAGPGWRLLLSPHPREAIEAPWPEESLPYSLRFPGLTMAILDVANDDDPEDKQRGKKYETWMEGMATRPRIGPADQTWLFLHRPLWVHAKCMPSPCEEGPIDKMRSWLRDHSASANIDLLFAGDTHMFQFFVPDNAAIPPQIVAGMSGTKLEETKYFDASNVDKAVGQTLNEVMGTLWMRHGFGFLVLRKQDDAWTATFHDADGKEKLQCKLAKPALAQAKTDFPCQPVPAP